MGVSALESCQAGCRIGRLISHDSPSSAKVRYPFDSTALHRRAITMSPEPPEHRPPTRSWQVIHRTNALQVFMGCGALFYACMMGCSHEVFPGAKQALFPIGMAVLALGFVQLFVRGHGRNIEIDLDGRELSFRGAELTSIALDDALLTLKRWLTPGFGTHFGTTLVIRSEGSIVTIGGAGYSFPYDLPESDEGTPDLYLDAAQFSSMLEAVDPQRALVPPAGSPRTIALTPNVTRGGSLLRQIAPGLLTMALTAAFVTAASEAGLMSTPEGAQAIKYISIFVAIAGLALTFVLARRASRSSLSLVVSDRLVELTRPGPARSTSPPRPRNCN
jgi:hypothetical protein